MTNRQIDQLNISLNSDFRDYYDHWFAYSNKTPSVVFSRLTTNDATRIENFATLSSYGLTVPEHGTPEQLHKSIAKGTGDRAISRYASKTHCVVFTDQTLHAGEGKQLMSFDQAIQQYPDKLASAFFAPKGQSTSLRFLRIGRRSFWLRYQSDDQWRSNCGNVDIAVLKEFEPSKDFGSHPLFAIDFVLVRGKLVALDFNTAPGIAGTGIENLMQAKQVYSEIALALVSPKPVVARIFTH